MSMQLIVTIGLEVWGDIWTIRRHLSLQRVGATHGLHSAKSSSFSTARLNGARVAFRPVDAIIILYSASQRRAGCSQISRCHHHSLQRVSPARGFLSDQSLSFSAARLGGARVVGSKGLPVLLVQDFIGTSSFPGPYRLSRKSDAVDRSPR
jgi:hypothetical protein